MVEKVLKTGWVLRVCLGWLSTEHFKCVNWQWKWKQYNETVLKKQQTKVNTAENKHFQNILKKLI